MDDLRKFTEEANSLSEGLASSNVFLLKRSIDLSLLRQGFQYVTKAERWRCQCRKMGWSLTAVSLI